MKWLSPENQPFELCGFPFYSRDHAYRRVQVNPPEPLPKEVDFLAGQTAGGQIRFRAVLGTLDIRVKLSAELEMDHMTATGEGGFDCYISEGTDEPLYFSTARLEAVSYTHLVEQPFFEAIQLIQNFRVCRLQGASVLRSCR